MRVAGLPGVVFKLRLGQFECVFVDNGLVFARKDHVADFDLPGIKDIAKQLVDVAATQRAATVELAVPRSPLLISPAQLVEPLDNLQDRRSLQIETEHLADALSFFRI